MAYNIYRHPSTEDKQLNLLLNNIYLSEKPDEAVYYQAIKRLNQTLTDAYTGRREPLNPNYIEAIK